MDAPTRTIAGLGILASFTVTSPFSTGRPVGRPIELPSLVAVTAFGLATAGSYATAGYIDWRIALLVIAGGVVGSIAGTRLNSVLAPKKHLLTRMFGGGVIAVGGTIVTRGLPHLVGASTS
jgi:uncharacterized protein